MNTQFRAVSKWTPVHLAVLCLFLGLASAGLLSGWRSLARPGQTAPSGEASAVHLSSDRHTAVFSPSGVQFTPARGPAWQWQVLSIGTADAPLAGVELGETTPYLAAPGLVVYPRGLLDEQYVAFPTHIEQQFVLHRPLNLNGADLVITGRVSSSGVFAAFPQGWLWHDENGRVSLGQVTVYDAHGAVLPAEMQVDAESIQFRVNSSALAAAAYPVTIDPEIGTDDFRISYSGADTDVELDAFDPAVTYNPGSDEFLVVWAGDVFPAGADDTMRIYARRIQAADGSFAGDTVMLPGATFNTTPAVAFSQTDGVYLVVFTCGNAYDRNTANLCGQRLDAAAAPAGDPFQVNTLANALHPAIAYNPISGEFLVVW
ncbi:MAG: hypothetical protein KC441_15805, partial [Anaerolineales bacterium]|nr:hypothetical protein [Anaerolineales bacterium]